MTSKRAFILMLDSFGVGATADANRFGDEHADTLRHIARACAEGRADSPGKRRGKLHIPNLIRLGIQGAALASTGHIIPDLPFCDRPDGQYGAAKELSSGKDTQSGHWELAGVPVSYEWGYFKKEYPCFPDELIQAMLRETKLDGVLGNKHASGTDIIKELGEEHQRTGHPIVYTSADSVFQIAAHEETFGLQRLYDICEIVRKLVDPYNIGRVIARPFTGTPSHYKRTGNRRDYATPPHAPTLLDHLHNSGGQVIAIGKIADIYAHRGITQTIKADGNDALFQALLNAAQHAPDRSLTFVNFVDFDMLYGHRRDVIGYAHALEQFDAQLPEFERLMQEGDIAILTADHGCDPTQPGSDHTREHVPVLCFGKLIESENIGLRDTFADIGQTIAKHLGLKALDVGCGF